MNVSGANTTNRRQHSATSRVMTSLEARVWAQRGPRIRLLAEQRARAQVFPRSPEGALAPVPALLSWSVLAATLFVWVRRLEAMTLILRLCSHLSP